MEIIPVLGVCEPERLAIARYLAEDWDAVLLRSRGRGYSDVGEALRGEIERLPEGVERVVIDCPSESLPSGVLAALLAPGVRAGREVAVASLLTVVDASHYLRDLADQTYVDPLDTLDAELAGAVPRGPISGGEDRYLARALVAAEQVEFARAVCVVNAGALSEEDAGVLYGVLQHLAPLARIEGAESAGRGMPRPGDRMAGPAVDTPGWIRLLNGEYEVPENPRVSGFRYEQLRPMHAGRLMRELNERVDRGVYGTLVRSAGFCRLASRVRSLARWSQVGHMIAFEPIPAGDGGPLAIGQEIALIGIDLDREGLRAALDACALTDTEFEAGATAWRALPDPLPRWHSHSHPSSGPRRPPEV